MRTLRVNIGATGQPHALHLQHPAGTQPAEDIIDFQGYSVPLEIGRTLAVGTCKIPSGKQAAVHQEQDPVIDHGSIGQEIGK